MHCLAATFICKAVAECIDRRDTVKLRDAATALTEVAPQETRLELLRSAILVIEEKYALQVGGLDEMTLLLLSILINAAQIDLNAVFGKNRDHIIFVAARMGSVPLIRLLLQHGARLDILRNVDEEKTPLHSAIIYEHEDAAIFIANNEQTLTWYETGEDGRSPIYTAIRLERPRIALSLLQSTGSHTKIQLSHALIAAVDNNNVDLCDALVSVGADPDFVDDCGATPIEEAVLSNNPRTLEYLLRCAGARQSIGNDELLLTPFQRNAMYYVFENRRRIAKILLISNPIQPITGNYERLRDTTGHGVTDEEWRSIWAFHEGLFNISTRTPLSPLDHACALDDGPLVAVSGARGYTLNPQTILSPRISDIVRRIYRGWMPSTHVLFMSDFRAHQKILLVVISRISSTKLPFLPLEMWFTIMSFVPRLFFPASNEYINAYHLTTIIRKLSRI